MDDKVLTEILSELKNLNSKVDTLIQNKEEVSKSLEKVNEALRGQYYARGQ